VWLWQSRAGVDTVHKPQTANRKPLTFGYPLVSSAASLSTQPACRSDTSSPHYHIANLTGWIYLGMTFTNIKDIYGILGFEVA
jgi:hypothetical protein